MELVLLTLFIAVSVPAWGIVIAKEITETGRNRKAYDAVREDESYWRTLLPAPRETEAEVEALFTHRYRRADPRDADFMEWFTSMKNRLFIDEGLAEDFRAIYGDTWETDARLEPSPFGSDGGYRWNLKGFHNSPIGDNLTIRWPEEDAVKALLLAKRGYIPRKGTAGRLCVNVIPYSYTDWNGKTGTAWYKHMETLLRQAGKPVTMYFYTNANQQSDGAYFSHHPGTERRW